MYQKIAEIPSQIIIQKNLFFKKEYFVIEENCEILAIICNKKYINIIDDIYPDKHYLKGKSIHKIVMDFDHIDIECWFHLIELSKRIYDYNDLINPRNIHKKVDVIDWDVYFAIKSIDVNGIDFTIEPFSSVNKESKILDSGLKYLKRIFSVVYNLLKLINDNVEVLRCLVNLALDDIVIYFTDEIKLTLKREKKYNSR